MSTDELFVSFVTGMRQLEKNICGVESLIGFKPTRMTSAELVSAEGQPEICLHLQASPCKLNQLFVVIYQ